MSVMKYLNPAMVRGPRVGGPHSAGVERNMIRATEGLVWRCANNVVQWTTVNGPYMCYAQVSSVGTWTDFDTWYFGAIPSVPFTMPYRMSEGFERIMGVVSIVSEIAARVRIRLQVVDCVDNITETNGEISGQVYPDEPLAIHGWSVAVSAGYNLSRCDRVAYVTPTDYSAPDPGPSRVMAIKPQIKIDEEDFGVLGVAATAVDYFLEGVSLVDVPAASVGL